MLCSALTRWRIPACQGLCCTLLLMFGTYMHRHGRDWLAILDEMAALVKPSRNS